MKVKLAELAPSLKADKTGLVKAACKSFGLKTLDDIEEKEIEWVWYPYFARGEITIVEGDPGAKKSFMIQAATRRLMDGQKLPSPKQFLQADPGNVVLFDCENSGETVLKKRYRNMRLRATERLFIKEDPFQMSKEDIDHIIDYLRPIRPIVVVFDTMNDYFESKANTNTARDVTQAMQPFRRLARDLNCAVVLVRHLTKDSNKKLMYRGQGSIAHTGKARIVISIGPHPDNPDVTCMVASKMQFGPKPAVLTYEVEPNPKPDEHDAFRFIWDDFEEIDEERIFSGDRGPGRPDEAREAAKQLLKDVLTVPVEAERIEKMANARNISMSTLRRAARELGVVKPRGGKSTWSLPKLDQN